MAILSPVDYPSVRRAIDSSLTSELLPDSIISDPLFQGAAEREVLARDPEAETRTGTEGERIRSAAILFTAARLAMVASRATDTTLGHLSYKRPVPEWLDLVQALRRDAHRELDGVVGGAKKLSHFVTAPGRRMAPR